MMKDKRADTISGLEWNANFRHGRAVAVALALAIAFSWATVASAQEKARSKDIVSAKKAAQDDSKRTPTDSPIVVPEGAPQPIISVDNLVGDFGVHWVGPTKKHIFKITNKGTKPLEIHKVRPSCGCTVAGDYPRTIRPGQTGDLPFTINSHKVRGKYEKGITVTSNDPVNSTIKLKLRGECKRYVDVLPAAANFGKVYGDENPMRILKVSNNTEEPLELELDVPSDSKFKFQIVETDPGKKYEVHVSLSPKEAGIGVMRTYALLKTNKEAQKEIKIGASASVPKRIDVHPATLTLPKKAPGYEDKPVARMVRVNNYGSTPARVLEATIDDPKVKVTINERMEGKRYDIRLELPGDWQPPAGGRTLTLKTDDKEFAEIKVPVVGPGKKPPKKPADRPVRPAEQLVGKPAPSFEVTTREGKKLSNQTLSDAITVLDFFAVNCGYCGKQIPRVEKMREKYADKGVRFVAVSQTMRKKFDDQAVIDKIKEFGFHGELAIDSDNKIGSAFKAKGFPTMVILGKSGKVEAVNIGNLGDLEKRMEGQLSALIAGKPVPKFEAPASAKKPRKRPAEEMKGKPAPQFSLTTLQGKPVASTDFTKHPATVLNFISPNCGYCKRQVPNVDKVRAEYEAKGVRFVNMSMKMGQGLNRETKAPWTPDEIVELFKKAGSNLELAIDEGNAVGKSFKATSFPTMMVVNREGKVEHVNIGAKKDIDSILKGQLDAMIKGKPAAAAESIKLVPKKP